MVEHQFSFSNICYYIASMEQFSLISPVQDNTYTFTAQGCSLCAAQDIKSPCKYVRQTFQKL